MHPVLADPFLFLQETIVMSLRKRFLKLDNYRWALLFGIPISIAILIPLLAMGVLSSTFLVPEWLVGCFFIPSFVGGFTASAGYIGRLIDTITNAVKRKKEGKGRPVTLVSLALNKQLRPTPVSKWETLFTALCIALAIALSLAFIFSSGAIPFVNLIPHAFACTIFTLANINIFAGLGNRFGSSVGVVSSFTNKTPADTLRLPGERIAMLAAVIIGLLLSITLAATLGMGLIPVAGITSFFIGTTGIPALTGTLFALSFTGQLTSATDYFSRAGYYLKYLYLKATDQTDENVIKYVQTRQHEYRGALVGVAAGLALGAIAVTALMLTQPQLFVGALGVIALVMVVVTAVSILGGIASRTGRLLDGFESRRKREKKIAEADQENHPKNDRVAPSSQMRRILSHEKNLDCFAGARNDGPEGGKDRDAPFSTNTGPHTHKPCPRGTPVNDLPTTPHAVTATNSLPCPPSNTSRLAQESRPWRCLHEKSALTKNPNIPSSAHWHPHEMQNAQRATLPSR